MNKRRRVAQSVTSEHVTPIGPLNILSNALSRSVHSDLSKAAIVPRKYRHANTLRD
jgi:hypothetical protein